MTLPRRTWPLTDYVLLSCHKSTKKASRQKGFFAHKAIAAQSQQNLSCNKLPHTAFRAKAYPSVNYCYALQPYRPPLFCRLLPEANLPTGYNNNPNKLCHCWNKGLCGG